MFVFARRRRGAEKRREGATPSRNSSGYDRRSCVVLLISSLRPCASARKKFEDKGSPGINSPVHPKIFSARRAFPAKGGLIYSMTRKPRPRPNGWPRSFHRREAHPLLALLFSDHILNRRQQSQQRIESFAAFVVFC